MTDAQRGHFERPDDRRPVTNDELRRDPARDCALHPGMTHDYRPRTYTWLNRPHTSLVCVWCDVVACGDPDQADPCMEPYHHSGGHRSRAGVEWPLGGERPDVVWS